MALIFMLLGITLIIFGLLYLTPGDFLSEARTAVDLPPEYIARMENEFGLNRPWYVQYVLWLKNALALNFGISWSYRIPVFDLISQRLPATLLLSATSLLLAWSIAIPLGILSAIYRNSLCDRVIAFLAYAALSIPEFFLALLAIYFAAQTGWFPIGGRTSLDHEFLSPLQRYVDYAHHLILPVLVLGLSGAATIMRIMRANFLDFMNSSFVTTARAKGLSEVRVMFIHVLRNAINPLIGRLGFAFSGLLSGSLIVENVMNYPGLGQLIYEAFMKQDQHVVMAAVLIGSTMLVLGNLFADLLLVWIDPRIRLEES